MVPILTQTAILPQNGKAMVVPRNVKMGNGRFGRLPGNAYICESGRSENVVSFLTYFRFPSSHTTVRAVRHTAVSCLSCPFWTPHIGHRHFFSIVGIRPIVLKREFLVGHLTTTVSKYTDCLVRQCTIRPFALTVTRSATSASADSSTFVVTILADCRGLAG